jgi:hypothetical protein
MSIWIDLLFMHGHFATPRILEHLLAPDARSDAPHARGPKGPTAGAEAIASAPSEVVAIALPEAHVVVNPGAFARTGAFVTDPVATTWPSAPVHHPLRVLGQIP